MRRNRPAGPWPFSVPQDVFAHRLRADGWTLLELAYERRRMGPALAVAEVARRYGVSRPTIYRWEDRVKEYPQLLRELEVLVERAIELLNHQLRERNINPDEYSSMRRRIKLAPMEAVRHYVLGGRLFESWLRKSGSVG